MGQCCSDSTAGVEQYLWWAFPPHHIDGLKPKLARHRFPQTEPEAPVQPPLSGASLPVLRLRLSLVRVRLKVCVQLVCGNEWTAENLSPVWVASNRARCLWRATVRLRGLQQLASAWLRRVASPVRWWHCRVEGDGYALEESGTAARPLATATLARMAAWYQGRRASRVNR